jgi:hypothetical protein
MPPVAPSLPPFLPPQVGKHIPGSFLPQKISIQSLLAGEGGREGGRVGEEGEDLGETAEVVPVRLFLAAMQTVSAGGREGGRGREGKVRMT